MEEHPYNTVGEHWVVYMSSDAQSLKGNRATFKYETTIAKPHGKKDVWRGEFTVTTSANRWTQAYANQTLNGVTQPNDEYVYERVKTTAAASPLPKEVAQELDYFVGDWALEGVGARGPMKSSWSMRWAPGGHCLMVEYSRQEPGKVVQGNGVWSWDSANGDLVYHTSYSDQGWTHPDQGRETECAQGQVRRLTAREADGRSV